MNLDLIIANTIPKEWARVHQPVLSSLRSGHIIYKRFNCAEPAGQLVRCPQGCNTDPAADVRGKFVHLFCTTCDMRCVFPLVKTDERTALGKAQLVATEFPAKNLQEYTVFWYPGTVIQSVEYQQPAPERSTLDSNTGGTVQEEQPISSIPTEDDDSQRGPAARSRGRARRSRDRQKTKQRQGHPSSNTANLLELPRTGIKHARSAHLLVAKPTTTLAVPQLTERSSSLPTRHPSVESTSSSIGIKRSFPASPSPIPQATSSHTSAPMSILDIDYLTLETESIPGPSKRRNVGRGRYLKK